MKLSSELGFVTSNYGKYQEAKGILGIQISQINFFFPEPQDVQGENIAIAKVKAAYNQYKRPVFVDHTSLYVLAWNNFPGGMIGTMLRQVGDAGILAMMDSFTNRIAIGETVVAFCDGHDVMVFSGQIRGTIPTTVDGIEYSGWDRIFIPDGSSKRYGEMTMAEKNSISQRGIALSSFKSHLEQSV